MRLEKRVELIKHDAGADAHRSIVDVEIVDLAIVAREIDDQSLANSISDQTRAGAAWRDRNVFISGGFDDRTRFLRGVGERDAKRLDLINRRVGGVKLARKIVETHIAAGSADPLLGGDTHHWAPIYHKNHGVGGYGK